MKPLSQALLDLTSRVQELETSTKAGYERDRADLEKFLNEIGDELKANVSDFEAAVREADAEGSKHWNETMESINRRFQETRARYQKKTEHEIDKAKQTADAAEGDAHAAVALANYCVTAAQYSIADAALARMAPNDAAGQKTPAKN